MNWFFKRRMKKGTPMSTKGLGDGLNGIDHCLATMTCEGGQIVRENGEITIIPNGSEEVFTGSESYFWRDYTVTTETETGEFRTTNDVTSGGLLPYVSTADVGTSGAKWDEGWFSGNVTVGGLLPNTAASDVGASGAKFDQGWYSGNVTVGHLLPNASGSDVGATGSKFDEGWYSGAVTVGTLLPDDSAARIGTPAAPFRDAYFEHNPSYKTVFDITPSSYAFGAEYHDSGGSLISDIVGPSANYAALFAGIVGVVTIGGTSYAINSDNAINISNASYGYHVSGTKVVGVQQGAIGFTTATATNGGYGFASATEFNAFIGKVNSIVLALGATSGHGLTAD